MAVPAYAQLDERLRLGGSYQLYAGLRLAETPDVLVARNRADLRLAFDYDRGRIVLRPRLDYDALGERLAGDLREAYLDVYFDRVDLRLGRQLIVWGKTDGTFVTDLLAPLDLTEFLAQPFDDLRLGVTAASATLYAGDFRVTGVAIPRRPTTLLPARGSPWNPLPDDVLGIPFAFSEPSPQDSTLGGAETALRVTWTGLARTDLALLWINGFNRIPAFRKGLELSILPASARFAVTPTYERRQVFGLTFETLALDPLVVRGEAAFHTSYLLDEAFDVPDDLLDLLDLPPEDLPETPLDLLDPAFRASVERGFLLDRPLGQAVLGLERSFGAQLFRAQALGTVVFDWDERVAQDRFEPALTLLWNGRFRRETLTAQAFALYNLGADFWLNPELTYAVRDALNATLGLQVFGGPGGNTADLAGLLREPAFSFATYRRNSFAYLRVAYSF